MPSLQRCTSTVQRGASRSERINQARLAFRGAENTNGDVPYLLVDDIVTTGATLYFAAKTLKSAGANTVWVATIARQPLD